MSHVHGRKPVLIFSILLHVAASALCGFAKNFVWLSLCRGLQGLAAGGMTILSMNTIVDISMFHGLNPCSYVSNPLLRPESSKHRKI